jgi:nitrogen fixation/metabolism regulation signal transduction histidine kinase
MPTAAKVVAALFFAALGYFSADLVKPLLPEGTRTQWMNEVVALFGVLMGWNVVGSRVGDGVRASLGYGITAALLVTIWSVGAFALADMLERSMDRRYRGVMDALQDMVRLISEFGLLIMVPSIFVAVVVGGAVGGWLSEWASRRWK